MNRAMHWTTTCVLSLIAATVIASSDVPARAPLPTDSVYQLRLPLTDQHGRTADWGTRRGKPQLVAMFYSSCPNMCPLLIDSGKAVEHALSSSERTKLRLVYISLDPARDTPSVLNALAQKRGLDPARWSLTAPRAADVRLVAGVLGVRYRQLADGQFNHTSALLLLDRDGRIVARTERIGVVDPGFVTALRREIDHR